MAAVPEAAFPLSWTSVNDNALLRLDVVEVGRALHLFVSDSAGQCEHYRFADKRALLTHHARREARLQAQGYTLAQTIHRRPAQPQWRPEARSDQRRQPVENR